MVLRSPVTLLLAAALPALVGCEANVFPVEVKGETTIQGSALPDLLTAFPAVGSFSNIDFNQSQEFQNQGITKEQVKSVRTEYVRLRILSPDTQDFSFLQSIQFFARAGDTERLVAEKHDIDRLALPAPNPVLMLDVTSVELQPFVTAPSMSIVVRGSGSQPPQDTKIQAEVGLKVEIRLL
jgi:hypothetical protein